MSSLAPFTRTPTCQKCGWSAGSVAYSTRSQSPDAPVEEFLACECGRCGYGWEMAVASASDLARFDPWQSGALRTHDRVRERFP